MPRGIYKRKPFTEKHKENLSLARKGVTPWNKGNKMYKNPEDLKKHERELGREWARKRRIKVLNHYSRGKMECTCCGEKEIKFLCIDHIKNDGYKTYIKGKRAAGTQLYRLIIKNNFPDGLQVLCHNCNCAKGFYGKCPHNNLYDKQRYK